MLQNTGESIWTSSIAPAKLQTVPFMWSMQVGKFPALSPEEGNRSFFMAPNAYSQQDLLLVSDGVW